MRNVLKIGLIAAILTLLGFGAVLLMSFPYRATAIVLADPREQRITLQEEVLPAIGTDAAVLESMVQIVRSDGFLLGAMRDLGLIGGSSAVQGREDEMKELAKFRRNMTVERKGATYLVEISYRADTGEEAARIANGLAAAFAGSQNQSRSTATESATRSLSTQLIEIRARLNDSEEAVAKFRADNGIVYVDERNTVQMRQLGELNQQLAIVRSATEEARARYDDHRSGGALTRGTQATDGEGAQLSYLRQQRAQLSQLRDQQMQIYGSRHPRLAQTQQALDGVDRDIVRERTLMADQLKAELDIALSKQAQIERQIGQLSADVTLTDGARVQLEALEREATANRELYQQLLSRNKVTDQLALLTRDNVRIVSEAVAPIYSTRPSLALLGIVIAFLSFAVATAFVVAANYGVLRKPQAPRAKARRRPAAPRAVEAAAPPRQPVVATATAAIPGSLLGAAPRRPATAAQGVYQTPRGRMAREDFASDPYNRRR